jgi:hypothetical protein
MKHYYLPAYAGRDDNMSRRAPLSVCEVILYFLRVRNASRSGVMKPLPIAPAR